jgi:signal transduction histidine kinase
VPPAGRDPREALFPILDRAAAAAEGAVDVEEILRDGLERLMAVLDAPRGAVFVKDPTSGVFKRRSAQGLDRRARRPPADGVIHPGAFPALHRALGEGGLIVLTPNEDSGPVGEELLRMGVESAILAPLRAHEETIGILVVTWSPERPPQDESRDTVLAAAQILALALANAQLFTGLQERARDLDRQVRQLMALSEVSRAVGSSLEERTVQKTVVAQALRLVPSATAVLLQGDPASPTVTAAAGPGRNGALPGGPHAARALAEGEIVVADGRLVCLPLAARRGQPPLGVLVLSRGPADPPFDDDEVQRLGGLVDQAAVAVANAELLSELRREQSERQALAQELVQAQEQERRRIAEDIHDGPVQTLVGLSLNLDAVRADLLSAGAEGAAQEVGKAGRAVRSSVGALRAAILDLHPMSLEELGVARALRAAVARVEERGITIDMDLEVVELLPLELRTVAFRALQEALANVVRHSGACRCSVRAAAESRGILLVVEDDGGGFDPESVGSRLAEGHLGLPAMRRRITLAGGRFDIDSAPGKGTRLRLWLPLVRPQGA